MDRTTAKTPEEREKLYREVFSSDVFLTGTNAVTEHGELYNVDGNGNRVAAMLFGPKKVLVFAGCNKIVRDIDDAAKRVKSCATPANAMRRIWTRRARTERVPARTASCARAAARKIASARCTRFWHASA